MNAAAFIEQVYAARRITQGRANIRKRAEVGTNPAWPDGSPKRMPYFFQRAGGYTRTESSPVSKDNEPAK